MSKETQIKLADQFQKMHKEKKILVLPNAWDAGGAVIFEKEGFSAIGTSSAGISYSLGYPDGEYISFDDILDTTKKIKKRISIPLSVDVERGYGKSHIEISENIQKVIEEGAVGINLEDGILNSKDLSDITYQCDLIEKISKLKDTLGINFVINARTDAYWLNISDDKTLLFEETVKRANLYLNAGADCIFVPGMLSSEEIKMFVDQIQGPLNIITTPNTPSIESLEKLGVARVSTGSA
ncbi:MAG: isocitrate lyase/phosphoenolpyruvate mutase family protein, partial [Campylobacteraceae bacterium]|nr:isocitrate lyase/phosphoenolpyruvate mutase family protein [Campylobacteraceae bacterium]